MLLQPYHLDIIVGRSISFERLIEDNKERYYETIEESISSYKGLFTVSDIERSCSGVSRDMIKKVFTDLKKRGEIDPLGRGPGAK